MVRLSLLQGTDRTGRPLLWWQTSNNDPKTRDVHQAANACIYWLLALEEQLDLAASKGDASECSVVIDRTQVGDSILTSLLVQRAPNG